MKQCIKCKEHQIKWTQELTVGRGRGQWVVSLSFTVKLTFYEASARTLLSNSEKSVSKCGVMVDDLIDFNLFILRKITIIFNFMDRHLFALWWWNDSIIGKYTGELGNRGGNISNSLATGLFPAVTSMAFCNSQLIRVRCVMFVRWAIRWLGGWGCGHNWCQSRRGAGRNGACSGCQGKSCRCLRWSDISLNNKILVIKPTYWKDRLFTRLLKN